MLSGMAAVGLSTAIAGCSGGSNDGATSDGGNSDGDDSSGDDSEMDTTTDSDSMDDSTTTDSGGDDSTSSDDGSDDSAGSLTFDYTFGDSDDSVGSSLTGLAVDFPDGSNAVANAAIDTVTLAGSDVSGDVDGTSTSNNDTTFTVDFAGNQNIQSGDQLVLSLSDVDEPSSSYEAVATVNPQSGGTEFSESF